MDAVADSLVGGVTAQPVRRTGDRSSSGEGHIRGQGWKRYPIPGSVIR